MIAGGGGGGVISECNLAASVILGFKENLMNKLSALNIPPLADWLATRRAFVFPAGGGETESEK